MIINKQINYSAGAIKFFITNLFHNGGRYHIKTSPLICSAYQWTGFYMITASVMKELKLILQIITPGINIYST